MASNCQNRMNYEKKTNVNLGFYVKWMNILLCWMTLWQKQLLVWPQSHAHVTQNCERPRERAEKKRGTWNEERVKRIVARKKVIGIFNLMKLHSIKSENNSSIVLANIVELLGAIESNNAKNELNGKSTLSKGRLD